MAEWYGDLLAGESTYQKDLILPNLLRLAQLKKGERVLDCACGPGFFAREFFKTGAEVIGVDVSRELIAIAKKNSSPAIAYHAVSADTLPFIANRSIDTIFLILAVQNIEDVHAMFKECARVLKPNGRLLMVMNHPAFLIPKASAWGWDSKQNTQYRRIDEYLSESKVPIEMHPGTNARITTIPYHRPVQFYFKALARSGFVVGRLEEWVSHKKSAPGPRAGAENRIRKEIPMFLFLEAIMPNKH